MQAFKMSSSQAIAAPGGKPSRVVRIWIYDNIVYPRIQGSTNLIIVFSTLDSPRG